MRVLLFGNAKASILTLRGLLENGHDVLAIAPPGGRGHDWHDSLMDECTRLGTKCYDLEDPNCSDSVRMFMEYNPDIILSTLYTIILSEDVISSAKHAVNFHPSLLPSYRGTAPLIWAIVEGERETGVTAHRMEKRVDCGEVFARSRIPINPGDTGFDLHNKAALEIYKLAMEVIDLFEREELHPIESLDLPESLYSSSVKRINLLDPSRQTVRKIGDIVRALAPPLPCAWLETEDGRLLVKSVLPVSDSDANQITILADGGNTVSFDGSRYLIAYDGILRVSDCELQ